MNLRNLFNQEEIDYIGLTAALSNYAKPRDKIRSLLESHQLIRVKKGLYVFGPDLALEPFSKEVLANQIYGPSYISLEYALGFYGLIPERVETVTSVTHKRDKIFDTPVGQFTYRYLPPDKFPPQINLVSLDDRHSILIASPEKALADLLILSKNITLLSTDDLTTYLYDDLRFDPLALKGLKIHKIKQLATLYHHHHVNLLHHFLGQQNK